MAAAVAKVAAQLGYNVPQKHLPFGGGGTDASAYAAQGFLATSLIGLSTDMIRTGLVYHTVRDTADNLDEKAIGAALDSLVK